jgi:hypothetical protein
MAGAGPVQYPGPLAAVWQSPQRAMRDARRCLRAAVNDRSARAPHAAQKPTRVREENTAARVDPFAE